MAPAREGAPPTIFVPPPAVWGWGTSLAPGSPRLQRAPHRPGARAQPHSGLCHEAAFLLPPQEGPEADIPGGERSVFYLLMKMLVSSSRPQLRSPTGRLIVKVRPAPAPAPTAPRPRSHSHSRCSQPWRAGSSPQG